MRDRILNGESFEILATLYSQDPEVLRMVEILDRAAEAYFNQNLKLQFLS